MNIESQIRRLARSNYWQSIYRASKECSGISLFENKTNFSGPQSTMLYWLSVYDVLYKELNEMEWDNLYRETIEDDFLTDAFLYWRSKQIEFKFREHKKEEKTSANKSKKSSGKNFQSYPVYRGPKNKGKT